MRTSCLDQEPWLAGAVSRGTGRGIVLEGRSRARLAGEVCCALGFHCLLWMRRSVRHDCSCPIGTQLAVLSFWSA